jgi:MerC mercury resistance protein
MWPLLLFLILVVFVGKNESTWGFSTTTGTVPPYRFGTTSTTTPTAISTARLRTRCWNSPRRSASDLLGDDEPPLPFTPLVPLPSLPSPHPQQPRKSRLLSLNTSKNPIAHRTTNGAPSENWQSHTSRRRILLILKSTANWASLLCLFDCTILPLLSLLLPLVGWMNTGSTTTFAADGSLGSSFQHFLCHGVHTLALYFVVPTGTATVIWNYWTGHRNRWVAAMGLAGIVLVGWTNLPGSISSSSSSLLLQQVQHHNHSLLSHDGSTVYQLLHLMGSLLLLGSNLVAQQVLGCDCGIPFCRPVGKNTWKKKKNPLLVVPLASMRSGTTTTTTTAMSLQTQMIHHKQRLHLQSTRLTVMEDV